MAVIRSTLLESENQIGPIRTKPGKNVIIIRRWHPLVSHDPVKNLPIGHRQQRFKAFQFLRFKPFEVSFSEGGKNQVQFSETAPLGTEQSFFAAHLDISQICHGAIYIVQDPRCAIAMGRHASGDAHMTARPSAGCTARYTMQLMRPAILNPLFTEATS